VCGPFVRTTRQNKYIITATCYSTKWIEARAIKQATTETIAKFVVEQLICRHGCPKILQSDNGSIFTSNLFKEITRLMGITHKLSTAYHPCSQDQVKRSHGVLNDCIAMYISKNQKNWDDWLCHIQFAINSSISEATGYSPFMLTHGLLNLTSA